jgi:quinolinate synthase
MNNNYNNTTVNSQYKVGISAINLLMPEMIMEINKMRKEKNAVILAHYYQEPEIQDIADFVGDSLALSKMAEKTKADIIVFAGVHFMAETAKIISPFKKVIIPDSMAGCSLADSCPADKFKEFIDKHPDHTVISYVNTSAAVKALSDIICTSSNAKDIVNSLPADEKIIFAPDRNLGNYINSITGRNMLLWDGACHVHEEFSLERIIELKRENPEAKIIAHPECQKPILLISEYIGSTAGLLEFTKKDTAKKYIVATESGILHQMIKYSPDKLFLAAPPNDSTCACNDCRFMKMITIKKLYICMKNEKPEIFLNADLIEKAQIPIRRMLEISEKVRK